MKKTLIVYFSNSGRTEKLVKNLSSMLEADINRIKVEGERDHIPFIIALFKMLSNKAKKISGDTNNPGDYENIIICSPIWGGRPAPAIINYILKYRNLIKNYSFIAVSSRKMKNPNKEPVFIIGREPNIAINVRKKEIINNSYDLSEFIKNN